MQYRVINQIPTRNEGYVLYVEPVVREPAVVEFGDLIEIDSVPRSPAGQGVPTGNSQ